MWAPPVVTADDLSKLRAPSRTPPTSKIGGAPVGGDIPAEAVGLLEIRLCDLKHA
jgi:hypothetical protein